MESAAVSPAPERFNFARHLFDLNAARRQGRLSR